MNLLSNRSWTPVLALGTQHREKNKQEPLTVWAEDPHGLLLED